MNQTHAAKQIGIEQSYLSKLESDSAWASDELLERICKQYKISVSALLKEVTQESLRGNHQYQGLVYRAKQRHRQQRLIGGGLAMTLLTLLAVQYLIYGGEEPNHATVSAKFVDIEGKEALELIEGWGGLKISGIESVEGKIDNLEFRNERWDIALAKVADSLGYEVDMKGAWVTLHKSGSLR